MKKLLLLFIAAAAFFGIWFWKHDLKAPANEDKTVVNGDKPDITLTGEEKIGLYLSPLDQLGRAGVASAYISKDTLQDGERGEIGHIRPAGFHTVKYPDQIEDLYLWNRCHLIMWALYGDDTNVPENLITGTRYMNVNGMLPIEKEVLGYIRKTGSEMYYRVTPKYTGDNLIADGVLIEALSKDGRFSLCRYVRNEQPGIDIDYKTGESRIAE